MGFAELEWGLPNPLEGEGQWTCGRETLVSCDVRMRFVTMQRCDCNDSTMSVATSGGAVRHLQRHRQLSGAPGVVAPHLHLAVRRRRTGRRHRRSRRPAHPLPLLWCHRGPFHWSFSRIEFSPKNIPFVQRWQFEIFSVLLRLLRWNFR